MPIPRCVPPFSSVAVCMVLSAVCPQGAAGQGQPQAQARGALRCESSNDSYQRCPATGTWQGARLVQQISTSPCIQGRTWGFDQNAIWVEQWLPWGLRGRKPVRQCGAARDLCRRRPDRVPGRHALRRDTDAEAQPGGLYGRNQLGVRQQRDLGGSRLPRGVSGQGAERRWRRWFYGDGSLRHHQRSAGHLPHGRLRNERATRPGPERPLPAGSDVGIYRFLHLGEQRLSRPVPRHACRGAAPETQAAR